MGCALSETWMATLQWTRLELRPLFFPIVHFNQMAIVFAPADSRAFVGLMRLTSLLIQGGGFKMESS